MLYLVSPISMRPALAEWVTAHDRLVSLLTASKAVSTNYFWKLHSIKFLFISCLILDYKSLPQFLWLVFCFVWLCWDPWRNSSRLQRIPSKYSVTAGISLSINEAQNHRISQVGRDPQGSPSSTPGATQNQGLGLQSHGHKLGYQFLGLF